MKYIMCNCKPYCVISQSVYWFYNWPLSCRLCYIL